MMKICFVGIHNKPGKLPLDSSTRTGKIIDRIIAGCGEGFEFEKRNLFDMDRMPVFWEVRDYSFRIDKTVFYIALGAVVRKHLQPLCGFNFLHVHHPGYIVRRGETEEYINDVISKINDHYDKNSIPCGRNGT